MFYESKYNAKQRIMLIALTAILLIGAFKNQRLKKLKKKTQKDYFIDFKIFILDQISLSVT